MLYDTSLRSLLISAASITLAGSCFYFILGPLALVPFTVVVAHEFAHFYTAKYRGAKEVGLPILIPIPPFYLLGLTKVIEPNDMRFVALSGPIVGMLASACLALVGLALSNLVCVAVSGLCFLHELLAFFFSSDARKARNRYTKKK